MDELTPCPFCGGTNVHKRTLPALFNQTGRGWAVVCFDCFARGPYVKNEKYGKTSHSAEAKREAAAMWNGAWQVMIREKKEDGQCTGQKSEN